MVCLVIIDNPIKKIEDTGFNRILDLKKSNIYGMVANAYVKPTLAPGDEIIVVADSEDVKDEIPLFSTLVRIDGTDIHDYIKEYCYPYIWHANEDACGIFILNSLV